MLSLKISTKLYYTATSPATPECRREEYKEEEYTHSGPNKSNLLKHCALSLSISQFVHASFPDQFHRAIPSIIIHTIWASSYTQHKHGLVITPIWVSLLACSVRFDFGCNTNPCFLWIPSLSLPTSGVATFPIPKSRKWGFPRAVQKTKKAILVKSELLQNGDS